jgi:PKD repeat protein
MPHTAVMLSSPGTSAAPRARTALPRLALLWVGLLLAQLLAVATLGTPAQADTLPPAGTPATVSADALPTPQVAGLPASGQTTGSSWGVVWRTAIVGTTAYAVGSFSTARPAGVAVGGAGQVTRNHILAFDVTTGALLPFAPVVNGQILSIKASPDGSKIYVGGDFTTINGVPRSHIAAFLTATGALDGTFRPSVGAQVRALAITDTTVYAGGVFAGVGSSVRTRLASFSRVDGTLLPWAPTADDDQVEALVASPDGSRVIVGGRFQTINGAAHVGIGAVDGVTGASLPWNSRPLATRSGTLRSWVTDLYVLDGIVYGSSNGQGTHMFDGRFAARFDNGDLVWLDNCYGASYGVYATGQTVYAVSHSHDCSSLSAFPQTSPATYRRGIAETTYAVGNDPAPPSTNSTISGQPVPQLLNWFPTINTGSYTGQSQGAWGITGDGTYLVLGGEFTTINGVAQQGLVRFASPPTAPNKVKPAYSSSVLPPAAVSTVPGTIKVSWPSTWDQDNATLRYELFRDTATTPVYSIDRAPTGWTPSYPSVPYSAPMTFTDTNLAVGSSHQYRLKVSDLTGNSQDNMRTPFVTVASAPLSGYAGDVVRDGAQAYWRLGADGNTTGTVTDWAGANDALDTLNAATTAVPTPSTTGVVPGAAGATSDGDTASTFDRTVPGLVASKAPMPVAPSFSVEAWVKTTTTSGGKIVGYGESNATSPLSLTTDRNLYMDNTGRVLFGVDNGTKRALASPTALNNGAYHHVVGTLDAVLGTSLYVDGVRVARDASVTTATSFLGHWRIGGDSLSGWPSAPTNASFAGVIDDVAVYPTALHYDAVAAHWVHNGGAGTAVAPPTDFYATTVNGDSPLSYWRLGETSGSTARDSSGNAFPGTYVGPVTFGSAGAIGGTETGVTLGSGGFVAATTSMAGPGQYSEELWFRTTTTSGGRLTGFGSSATGTSSTQDRQVYLAADGKIVFANTATNKITSAAAYNNGQWHHVVATRGPSALVLYVDGVQVATTGASAVGSYTGSGFWRVGADATGVTGVSGLAGDVDEAAFYVNALTAAQVASHRSAGVPNAPPTARITGDCAGGLTCSFDASGSTDADGIATYAFAFGDGATSAESASATVSHTYSTGGTKTVTVTVTDTRGASSTNSVDVVATVPNQPPTPALTVTCADLHCTASATGSTDADGTITTYAFDFGDGSPVVPGSSDSATHDYAAGGGYTVTLTLTDDDGATAQTTKVATASAPNVPPTAALATPSCSDLTCSFDASGSSDSDGGIVSYAFDFGDGSAVVTGTSATTTHTYAVEGDKTTTVTVTDTRAATATATATATPTAPVVLARDSFGRTSASGWGSAETGGPWSTTSASSFSVSGGKGLASAASGTQRSIFLTGVSGLDTDVTATWTLDKLVTGTGAAVYDSVVARRTGSADYRAKVRIQATGAVGISLYRLDGVNPEFAIKSEVAVPTAGPYTLGAVLQTRLQVVGANPTTVRARVWPVGQPEPTTWQVTATDSTAVLQSPGGVGLVHYASSSVTNGPIVAQWDDLEARSLVPPNVRPTASFTQTCTDQSCAFDATGSTDSDGTLSSFAWTFGDGTTGTGATPTRAYVLPGTYTVTMTVTDNRGGSATTSHPVTVLAPNTLPTAAFTQTCSGLTCSFDGTSSNDPDGSVSSYAWDFADGTGAGSSLSHTFTAGGTYTVALTVTDNRGGTGTTSHPVTVTAPVANTPPTASFTYGCTGLACSFDGSTSGDSDGTVSSYAWSFADGPGTASGDKPRYTFSAPGTYAVVLTVTDDRGATATATTDVTVSDAAPTAAFTSSCAGLACSFDGSTSTDADGTVSSYAWQFSDGAGSGVTPTHTFSSAGDYSVTLTVTDNRGVTGTSTSVLTVTNNAPTAAFTQTCIALSCSFDATASADSDGTVAGYAWTFGDAGTGSGATPNHTYAADGTYLVTLTVTDNAGGTTTTSHSVTVALPVNNPPTASFTEACTGLTCGFDASASSDSDGTVAAYAWDFGDSTTGTGVSPTHTYAAGGTYTVVLTVTDNAGATGASSHPVSVTPPNTAPTASFTVTCVYDDCSFNGSASTDPDGSVSSWSFDFGDGTAPGTGATTTHRYASAGTQTATLTVTDNRGATATTTRSVAVVLPFARDAFSRTVASGWGTADTGGPWTATGTPYAVGSGYGTVSAAAGSGPAAYLNGVKVVDVDEQVTFTTDKPATGTGIFVSLIGRRISGVGDYRAKVRMQSTGVVGLSLVRTNSTGAETAIRAETTVTGLTYAAGTRLVVRLQVSGTTVRAKVWAATATEPTAWSATVTDTTAGMSAAGVVGVLHYLSSGATNGPIAARFDDYLAGPPR